LAAGTNSRVRDPAEAQAAGLLHSIEIGLVG